MKTSRTSSSLIVSTTPPTSRPSSAESSSRGTLTTPLPEVTLVAEKLARSSTKSPLSSSSNKYRVNYGYDDVRQEGDDSVYNMKRNIREHLPEDWDLESTASLNSELRRLDDNIKTISEIISHEKEILYNIEPRAPSRMVTCIFSTCYFTLGATIVIVIVMTVMYDFGMLLLLCLMVTIFIILIILTNICVIIYQH